MNKKLQNQIFIAISTLLAIVFVYILYTKIDKEKTLYAFAHANYLWLIISMLLGVVSYQLRAKRWNILFEPMGIRVKNASAFWVIAFSYFMNLTIPRSGEIARATSLYSLERVPVEKSIGTIVLERIIDFLFLLTFLFLTLVFSPQPFYAFLELSEFEFNINWVYYLIGVVFLISLIVYIFRNTIRKWKGFQKLKEIWKGFKEGLLSIGKIKNKTSFVLYSFGIWLCYFLMTFLVIFSFEVTENIPWNYGFFLMIAGSFGMIFPATGGLAYPLVMRYAFGAIFLSLGKPLEEGYDAGNYFGISLYLAQIVMVVIMGVLSIMYISQKKVRELTDKAEI